MCDKNKWAVPVYECEPQQNPDGGSGCKLYVCKCSLPSMPGDLATSTPMASMKLAKQSAALAWLIRLGLRKADDFPPQSDAQRRAQANR